MKFTVFYRTEPDGRAPEFPDIEHYEEAGDVETHSRKSVISLFAQNTELPDVEMRRPLKTGDLIKDQQDQYFIVTPVGQMAMVTLRD